MRLIGRHDTPLVAALVVGALLLFQQPLRFVFDMAGDIERQYHLDLVQALVVLTVVFVFHQYRKRHEAKGEARAAAAEAQQARVRTEELERLVGLGRALANVTDLAELSQVLVRFVPQFTADRAAWVLICSQEHWDVLLRDTNDRRPTVQLEALAEHALLAETRCESGVDGLRIDDVLGLQLMRGSNPLGVLLVRDEPPLSLEERRGLEAAAALTAIAIRNVQMFVEIRDLSLRDGLTGCFNRTHALETLTAELSRAHRYDRGLSVLMFDVDSFKAVNDSQGHLAGDQLLAEIGRRLRDLLRTTDTRCRYGGDEFLVILPDTPAIGARHAAESLRQALSGITLPVGDRGSPAVTVSVGVATAQAGDREALSIIARADRALYQAKRHGRNCVCVDESEAMSSLRLVSTPA